MSEDNSAVECDLAKVEVAGSIPVPRSIKNLSPTGYANRGYAEEEAIEQFKLEGYDIIHKGKPDLILLKDKKIIFVEVKGISHTNGKESVSPSQRDAIALLQKHGYEARILYIGLPPTEHEEAMLATREEVYRERARERNRQAEEWEKKNDRNQSS